MTTEIVTKPLCRLTDDEYRRCLRLSMGRRGYMWHRMKSYRSSPPEAARVTMILKGDRLEAWSLLTRHITEDGRRLPWDLDIYVRSSERNKGHGKTLLKRALLVRDKPLRVYGWCYKARLLYWREVRKGNLFESNKGWAYRSA